MAARPVNPAAVRADAREADARAAADDGAARRGTGFFTLSMASRAYLLHGPGDWPATRSPSSGCRSPSIAVIAAMLGFSIALGVTRPVRQVTEQLEALASGDLRGTLAIASTSELDSLGGAFNDAISAMQRYYLQSMTGAIITLDADGRVIGSSRRRRSDARLSRGRSRRPAFQRCVHARVWQPCLADRGGNRDHAPQAGVARRRGDPRGGWTSGAHRHLRVVPAATHPDRRRSADEVVGVTIAFKDLNQMRTLQARLQQADQLMALGTVTAGVAHEIRNPLASLRGSTELLGRDIPPRRSAGAGTSTRCSSRSTG